MSTTKPQITLYFLQASRSIRIAWLLEELSLPYDLKFYDRLSNNKAPPEFKSESRNALGKAPTLVDGDLVLCESGAITEYLCEKYDTEGRFLPKVTEMEKRAKVLMWIHAAEATFLLHALAIVYARWTLPSSSLDDATRSHVLGEMEATLSVNVRKDLDWLEEELEKSGTRFLCGEHVTVADVMMGFGISYIFTMGLGTKGQEGRWARTRKWVEDCEGTEGYRRAVEKSGHRI